MNWSEQQINTLIRKIYNGRYNALKLPKKLYNDIASHFTDGVYKGYGDSIATVAYDSPDFAMLSHLRENVYLFSAAKTFNYVLDTENLIVEGNEVLPFKVFKERALSVYSDYNKTWLETEYNTAIAQSQHARAWNDFDEDAILKYMLTSGVEHAQVCLDMQGVCKHKSDPIWIDKSPQNHFGCLCYLDASFDNKPTKTPSSIASPDQGFANNPGITKEVFNKEHPYFDVDPKYKKFAKTNFGLPLPE